MRWRWIIIRGENLATPLDESPPRGDRHAARGPHVASSEAFAFAEVPFLVLFFLAVFFLLAADVFVFFTVFLVAAFLGPFFLRAGDFAARSASIVTASSNVSSSAARPLGSEALETPSVT